MWHFLPIDKESLDTLQRGLQSHQRGLESPEFTVFEEHSGLFQTLLHTLRVRVHVALQAKKAELAIGGTAWTRNLHEGVAQIIRVHHEDVVNPGDVEGEVSRLSALQLARQKGH